MCAQFYCLLRGALIPKPLQNRPDRPAKGNVDSPWSHDLYDTQNSLSARLNVHPTAPKANLNALAQRALREANSLPSESFSIKGASVAGNVVEVKGLVDGTTAEDVEAIFKRCGVITKKTTMPGNEVTIRLTFKEPSAAASAISKFHNQAADGKTLSVRIVGSSSAGTTLGGRLGGEDGLGLVRQEGSVDVLMDADSGSGSFVFFFNLLFCCLTSLSGKCAQIRFFSPTLAHKSSLRRQELILLTIRNLQAREIIIDAVAEVEEEAADVVLVTDAVEMVDEWTSTKYAVPCYGLAQRTSRTRSIPPLTSISMTLVQFCIALLRLFMQETILPIRYAYAVLTPLPLVPRYIPA